VYFSLKVAKITGLEKVVEFRELVIKRNYFFRGDIIEKVI